MLEASASSRAKMLALTATLTSVSGWCVPAVPHLSAASAAGGALSAFRGMPSAPAQGSRSSHARMALLDKVLGKEKGDVGEGSEYFDPAANERQVARYMERVARINALEDDIEELDDDALAAKTVELRARLQQGESEDDILEDAFAVVREAAWRALELRHYDVQLVGGMALHDGQLAEMGTGEGKTLVATSAVYLHALSGKGSFVVTVNDYLARRDAETMGQVYSFLGLKVGLIQQGMSTADRREAYSVRRLASVTRVGHASATRRSLTAPPPPRPPRRRRLRRRRT